MFSGCPSTTLYVLCNYCFIVLFGLMTTKLNKLYYKLYYVYLFICPFVRSSFLTDRSCYHNI